MCRLFQDEPPKKKSKIEDFFSDAKKAESKKPDSDPAEDGSDSSTDSEIKAKGQTSGYKRETDGKQTRPASQCTCTARIGNHGNSDMSKKNRYMSRNMSRTPGSRFGGYRLVDLECISL